jgi:hypothetical protein
MKTAKRNLMIRGRHKSWPVVMMVLLTTRALLPCRSALSSEHVTTSDQSTGNHPNIVIILADDI